MDLLSPIKDHHSERRLFIGRVALASTIGLLLLGGVVARLVQLQVFDYEMFAEQSQGNRFRIEAVPPTRGLTTGAIGRAYGATNTPHMFIVHDGKIVYEGAIDNNPRGQESNPVNYVRKALDELTAKKPVSKPKTKAYG